MMRAHRVNLSWLSVAAGASLMLLAQPASAQPHPDIHGGWVKTGEIEGESSPPPLTPEGQKMFERNKAGIAASDPSIDVALNCLPTGFPRTIFNGFPIYIAQDSAVVAILGESSSSLTRKIWMDVLHPGLWPTYLGDSVGHWEGDTLVVDTISVKTSTFYSNSGLPHSDAFHVVERFRLLDGGKQLEDRATFEDPKFLTRPWTVRVVYKREDKQRPLENVCDTTRLKP